MIVFKYTILPILIIMLIFLLLFVKLRQNESKKQIITNLLSLANSDFPVLILFCNLQSNIDDIVKSPVILSAKSIMLIYSGPVWKMNKLKKELPRVCASMIDERKKITNSLGLDNFPSFAKVSKWNRIRMGRLY